MNTQTADKEVLHTQGEWRIEPDKKRSALNCFSLYSNNTYLGLFSCSVGRHEDMKEWMATGKANAELIVKAVNNYHILKAEVAHYQKSNSELYSERQKLLDSNRELLEALTETLKWKYCYDLRLQETEAFKNVISKGETAIKNAKNI